MSNYTKTTNFAAKDTLPSGNSGKIVRGSEIDTEYTNIQTAVATKLDTNNGTLTGTTTFETISDGTIAVTGFVDEDNMASDSATLVPTQQSVKAYVDSQVTAQDLDFQADSGGALSIDLDSETLTFTGGTGIDTSGALNAVTFAIDSTVATLTGSQTLTNKTLTSPTLNTPTIGTSFTIGAATITEAELEILDGATVTTAELNILDGVTATTAELNILDGVTSTAAELNILDGVTATTAELNILDGVTSTAAELNILDGVTSTTAELNILDGVTSTTAELNILDGVTSTTAELNILDGVTATTAELNYVDGVTSAIQTQLDAKASTASPTFTGTVTIPTADVNGGNIDGTTIGGTTAAAGTFTTITGSDDLAVDTDTLFVDASTDRVGINTASPGYELDVQAATDPVIQVSSTGTASTDDAFMRIQIGGTTASSQLHFGDSADEDAGRLSYDHSNDELSVFIAGVEEFRFASGGTFHADADIVAYSTTVASDAALKYNIEPVENALDKLNSLDGVTFQWKKNDKASAGVIAQDVEKVMPSAVKEVESIKDNSTHKAVDYNQIIALLVEAVKDQQKQIDELRK